MITDMEANVLQETARSAGQALESIHTMMAKVHDDALANELNSQADHYRKLGRKAKRKLLAEGIPPQGRSRVEKATLWCSLHASTLLNTSTGHVAELMIQENKRGITDMMKTIRANHVLGVCTNETRNREHLPNSGSGRRSDLPKAKNAFGTSSLSPMEIAEEFMNFEEKNIDKLKKYM